MSVFYQTIRGAIRTGDVFAFSGKGRVSEVIKWRTGSPYSHVGVALRIPEYDAVMLCESTTLSDLPNVLTGNRVRGAGLYFLRQRLRSYDGEVWWVRQKAVTLGDLHNRARQKALEWCREETPYDSVQACGAGVDWWDGLFGNEPDFSALFCSELVARFHQIAGNLDQGFNPSEATPGDVVAFDFLEAPVKVAT